MILLTSAVPAAAVAAILRVDAEVAADLLRYLPDGRHISECVECGQIVYAGTADVDAYCAPGYCKESLDWFDFDLFVSDEDFDEEDRQAEAWADHLYAEWSEVYPYGAYEDVAPGWRGKVAA
jgi:hypothetical protein